MRPRVRNIIIINITVLLMDSRQNDHKYLAHFVYIFLTLLTKPRVRVVNGYLRPKAPLLGYIRPALANRLQDDDDDNEDCHIDDNVDHGNNSGFDST